MRPRGRPYLFIDFGSFSQNLPYFGASLISHEIYNLNIMLVPRDLHSDFITTPRIIFMRVMLKPLV